MKTTTRRLLSSAGFILALAIAGTVVHVDTPSGAEPAPSASAAVQAIPVSVATVEPREVTIWQTFSGRLEAVDRVEVRSRVAGAIEAVHFREGAFVKAGEPLLTIDPAPYEAAVAQAEASVAAARARLELTRLELERGQKLVTTSAVSRADVDQRRSAFEEAKASLAAAEAALRAARLDLGHTEVRAPISGRIGRLEITAGNLVAAGAGSPVLATIVSVDPIYATFSVSEELIGRLLAELPRTPGGAPDVARVPVEIGTAGDEGTPIRGHLQLIDNEVDRASGTVQVRAVFDNPDGQLIPGQFVRVRMGEPNPERQLLVSERAVGTDQDKKFVFVVGPDNTLTYRQIELGPSAGGLRVVRSGLAPGERIVVNGLQRVRAGATIEPQPVAMAGGRELATAQTTE